MLRMITLLLTLPNQGKADERAMIEEFVVPIVA